MNKIKILWIEDDLDFGPSIHFRIEDELADNKIQISGCELLKNGDGMRNIVRDWKPDVIMMDHNLEDVRINGANLIAEIRLYDHDTPIIYYSSEMDEQLISLVKDEHKVFSTGRKEVHNELTTLLIKEFTS